MQSDNRSSPLPLRKDNRGVSSSGGNRLSRISALDSPVEFTPEADGRIGEGPVKNNIFAHRASEETRKVVGKCSRRARNELILFHSDLKKISSSKFAN